MKKLSKVAAELLATYINLIDSEFNAHICENGEFDNESAQFSDSYRVYYDGKACITDNYITVYSFNSEEKSNCVFLNFSHEETEGIQELLEFAFNQCELAEKSNETIWSYTETNWIVDLDTIIELIEDFKNPYGIDNPDLGIKAEYEKNRASREEIPFRYDECSNTHKMSKQGMIWEFNESAEYDDELQIQEDWEFVLSQVRELNPDLIDFLKVVPIHYVPDLDCAANFTFNHDSSKELICLNVSEKYFELKVPVAIGVLLHELAHVMIVVKYLLCGDVEGYLRYCDDNEGHNMAWWNLVHKLETYFGGKVTVKETLVLDDLDIYEYPEEFEDDFELFESKRLAEADKSRFINRIWPQIELNAMDIMEAVGQDINVELSGADLPVKDQVVAFANSNASDKYKIDWNDFNSHDNDTLWDVTIKLISSFVSYSTSRKNKKDPKRQFQNEHFEILDENEDWLFVAVLDYNGAVYCDNYKCGGAGAKWCIGYEKSDKWWTDYTYRDLCRFVLAYNKKTYGDIRNQKYMIQLFPNNIHATQTWRQSDKPDEILHCNETLKKFNLASNKVFEEWYNELSPTITGVQSFSLAGIQNEAVTVSSAVCASCLELLPEEIDEAFSINYVDMLRNVKGDPRALASIDWLVRSAQPDEEVLNLGNVRLMGSDPSDAEFVAESKFKPALLFRNFDTVYIKTLWIGYNTPTIKFENCKNVKIGRCFMPRPESREDYLEALKTGNLEKAVRDNYLNISYAKNVNVTIDELAILPRNSLSKMDISKSLSAGHVFISTEDLGKHPIDVTGSERIMFNLLHIADAYNKPAVDDDNKNFYIDKAIKNFNDVKSITVLNLPFDWKVTWLEERSDVPRVLEYPCSGEF